MSIIKKIGLGVLLAFFAIQFFRPSRNESTTRLPTDITLVNSVPDTVQTILKKACYDCHSNNTIYPWYMNVQPAAWLLANHIKDGKHNLNFSEFGAYSKRKQEHKAEAIAEHIRDNEMPLQSYKLMHPEARLNNVEKGTLIAWARNLSEKTSDH